MLWCLVAGLPYSLVLPGYCIICLLCYVMVFGGRFAILTGPAWLLHHMLVMLCYGVWWQVCHTHWSCLVTASSACYVMLWCLVAGLPYSLVLPGYCIICLVCYVKVFDGRFAILTGPAWLLHHLLVMLCYGVWWQVCHTHWSCLVTASS